jgi:dihydrofolate reductase
VIMGRKTWESLPVKPLPGRTNIIVTREDIDVDLESALVHHNLNLAIADAKRIGKQNGVDEVFIIGGGEIFRQSIDLADKLYITKVKGDFGADTFFPDYSNFKKQVFKKSSTDGKHDYTFLELEK